jgi:hypothetical protein
VKRRFYHNVKSFYRLYHQLEQKSFLTCFSWVIREWKHRLHGVGIVFITVHNIPVYGMFMFILLAPGNFLSGGSYDLCLLFER